MLLFSSYKFWCGSYPPSGKRLHRQLKEMKKHYGKITTQTIEELIALLDKDSISTRKSDLENYARDEMTLPQPHLAQVIAKPADTASASRLLAYAYKHRLDVTPRGAGTGLSV